MNVRITSKGSSASEWAVWEQTLAWKLKEVDRRRRSICQLLETSSDGFKHSGSIFVRFKL
jgi:hypothetical protein